MEEKARREREQEIIQQQEMLRRIQEDERERQEKEKIQRLEEQRAKEAQEEKERKERIMQGEKDKREREMRARRQKDWKDIERIQKTKANIQRVKRLRGTLYLKNIHLTILGSAEEDLSDVLAMDPVLRSLIHHAIKNKPPIADILKNLFKIQVSFSNLFIAAFLTR